MLLMWTEESWRASAVSISFNLTEDQRTTALKAGEVLGTAALVLSVVALVLVLVALLWLALRSASANLATANSHQSEPPFSQPRGAPPKASADTDVYMNYSCGNESYTNLDPTSMDSTYSSMP